MASINILIKFCDLFCIHIHPISNKGTIHNREAKKGRGFGRHTVIAAVGFYLRLLGQAASIDLYIRFGGTGGLPSEHPMAKAQGFEVFKTPLGGKH